MAADQDRPVVTVSGAPASGPAERARRPARADRPGYRPLLLVMLAVLAAAVLALVLASVLAAGHVRADRTQAARAADALAAADRVSLRFDFLSFQAGDGEPGSGVVSALVRVTGDRSRDRVAAVRLRGPTVTPGAFDRRPLDDAVQAGGYGIYAEAELSCTRIAREPGPTRAVVEIDVVPPSGVTHLVPVPVPDALVRQQGLVACGLPDPAERTGVEASVLPPGQLALVVTPVDRHRRPVVVEAARAPGLVFLEQATPLPYRLPPATAVLLLLDVRVEDCGLARSSALEVQVLITDDEPTYEVIAGPAVSQPQPQAVPTEVGLRRLVDVSCPRR